MNDTGARHKLEQLSLQAREFGRSSSGAALLEYALLLSLLIAGGAAAWGVVAVGADSVFRNAAHLLGSGEASDEVPSTVGTAGHSSGQREPIRSDGLANMQTLAARIALAALGISVWLAIVAVGLLLWRLLRWRLRGRCGTSSGCQHVCDPPPLGSQEQLVEKRQQIRHLFSRDIEDLSGTNTQVRRLMSKRLMIVKPEMPACQVAAMMCEQRIRHLLVCRDNRLVGIISDRDFKQQTGETAADIMTSEPITIPPEMTVSSAISVMVNKSISCLPVVDKGAVCGILTTTDLMLTLQCTLQIVEGIAFGLCSTGCQTGLAEPAAADLGATRSPEVAGAIAIR